MSDKKKAPRFHGLRIYIFSMLIFFMLVMPIALFLLAKYGPVWEGATQTGDNKFVETLELLLKMLVISFLMGFAFNLPYKIYFRKKRKGKKISDKLKNFCTKYIIAVPTINVGIIFISLGTTLIYMLVILLFTDSFDEITGRFYWRFFVISVFSTILTLLFVYFWEKHRVHLRYIDHIYPEKLLRKRIFGKRHSKVRYRLWISNAMTTIMPLFIVMFYLFMSVSTIRELEIEGLTEEHLKVLFGQYLGLTTQIDISDFSEFFYVNVFDSIMMFSGIITGIVIAVIYLIFFVNWTTRDIVEPVGELLENMQATGRGEINQYSIVRTNDEVGALTEGYNDMSQRIADYIESISRINEANARFVPKQFLEYLGKDNISDIHLGDQVQKEMTTLFADIRNFTGISEEMTPRENFNFLNNYLGYMEPVIRNNKGFVDKYIGDSIMALFSDRAEDAINASIEMQLKLVEFNHVIQQFGRPPIEVGIGIHTGNLMLGIVGGEGRMDGTVISDAVNLTSRLEGLTKLYGASIIISEDTLIRINDPSHYNYRFLDIVKVKGKKEAVYIFEILDGEKNDHKEKKIATKAEFGKALQLYKNKQFDKAMDIFLGIYSGNQDDRAAWVYIQRCKRLIREGIPDDWDGIERIENKFD
ncbi:MAG: adenylate/guanylate cyclase domain-containing protein [Bacteroidales bacterium]|nr:adenylate/guanylate cyclase domain-containing protein [Bacteroidales bacterium]MCF8377807.1 adenylate/guanylate cyclase domain-containing protein [Bacteroidales bacterium]